jgi:hypothetical protein
MQFEYVNFHEKAVHDVIKKIKLMANKILVYIAMIHSSKIKINFVMYKFEAKLNSSNCAQQVVCLLDAVSD